MDAKDATIAVLIGAYAAEAHELRLLREALRILASMLGEPVDMDALRTMAAHRLAEQGCVGETKTEPRNGGSVRLEPPGDVQGAL